MKKSLSFFLCAAMCLSMVVPVLPDEYPDDVYVSDEAEYRDITNDWNEEMDWESDEDGYTWSDDGYESEDYDEFSGDPDLTYEDAFPDDVYSVDDEGTDGAAADMPVPQDAEEMPLSGDGSLTDEPELAESIAEAAEVATLAGSEEILKQDTCGENATYELRSNGTLYIRGHGDTYDYDSRSPVCALSGSSDLSTWPQYRTYRIEVEEGITSIGSYLFGGLSKATEVSLPTTITRIGEGAFYNCSSLLDIKIPDSVTEIDSFAFKGCFSLTEITFPPQISVLSHGICARCANLEQIHMDYVTEIGELAFEQCCNLNDLYVPEGVQIIREQAFASCSGKMTYLYLPDTVLELGANAFNSCKALEEVRLPEGITELPSGLFSGCRSLKKPRLPQSLTKIGRYVFSSCKLEEIDIPASVTSIDVQAFDKNSTVQKVTFRGSMPEIGQNAFRTITADGFYPAGDPTWQGVSSYFYGGSINWGELGVSLEANKEEAETDEIITLRAHINTDASMDEVNAWTWSVEGPENRLPGVLGNGLLQQDIAYDYLYIQQFHASEPGIYKVKISGGTEETTDEIELKIRPKTPENIKGSVNQEGYVRLQWDPVDKADGYHLYYQSTSTGKLEKTVVPASAVKIKKGKATTALTISDIDAGRHQLAMTSYVHQEEETIESLSSGDKQLVEGIEYTVSDGHMSITNWSKDEPDFLDEEDVPWKNLKNTICTLNLSPEKIEKIDDYSFKDCYALRAVTFEGIVPSLHEAAFTGCHVTVFVKEENANGTGDSLPDGVDGWILWKIQNVSLSGDLGKDPGLVLSGRGTMENLTPDTQSDVPWYDSVEALQCVEFCGGISSVGNYNCYEMHDLKLLTLSGQIEKVGKHILPETEGFGDDNRTKPPIRINIRFLGNAPDIADDCFEKGEFLAYVPSTDVTWTEEKMTDYGGLVSWGKIEWTYGDSEHLIHIKTDTETYRKGKSLSITGTGPIPDYYSELELPWSLFNGEIAEIRIEEGVTEIGTHAFDTMQNAARITIPSSVKSVKEKAFLKTGEDAHALSGPQIWFFGDAPAIDTAAFGADREENNNLYPVDIYYNKEGSGWDEVIDAEYRNHYLAWIPGDPVSILTRPEVWGFKDFDRGYIMLRKEDEKRLLRNLDSTEAGLIKYTGGSAITNRNYAVFDNLGSVIRVNQSGGSCRGFSVSEAVLYGGFVNPGFITGPIGEHEKDSPGRTTESFINFYHLQQYLPAFKARKAAFMEEEQIQQLRELDAIVSAAQASHEMAEISFQTYYEGLFNPSVGHTLMGYAVEKGKFETFIHDECYVFDHRILTYDPNEYKSLSHTGTDDPCGYNYHTHAFYYSLDEQSATYGTWTIPYKFMHFSRSSSNSFEPDNAENNSRLTAIGRGNNYLNAIDYETGDVNFRESMTIESLHTTEQNFDVISSDGRSWHVRNGALDSSSDGGAVDIMPTNGDEEGEQLTLVFTSPSECYTVISQRGGDFSYYNSEEGILMASSFDSEGSVEFSRNGVSINTINSGMKAVSVTKDSILNDEGKNVLPKNTLILRMNGTDMLEAVCTDEGVMYTSGREGELEIVTQDIKLDENTSVTQPIDGELILITAAGDDEDDFEVRKDTDGDGSFETVVATTDNLGVGSCEDFDWFISRDGILTISGDGAVPAYQSDYADEAENEDGREKAPWEQYRETIVGVTIEEGITSIGDYVFAGATSLKRIAIPPSVTEFGENIFAGCSDVVIYGDKDSGAELYAKDNSLLFIDPERVECAVISGISDKTYTGTPIIQDPVVELDGQLLIPGQDYTVSYENNLNAGEATVTITGRGAFSGAASVSFVIKAKSLKDAEVSAISDKTYTGSAFKPKPVVTLGAKTLVLNQDYYLAYKNNTKVGKATIAVKGMGNYSNVAVRYFNIKAASVKNASITGITSKVYTGSALTQKPVVKIGGKTLKLNTDYYLAYKNNINTGKATIAIKGKGNYNNVAVRYFAINPKPSWIASLSSPKTKQIKITWGKRIQISGYQIEISTKKNFAKPKQQKNVYDPKKLSMTVSVSKAKTTYYVRIRSFKKTKDKTYFSAWSATKVIKTK